MKHRRLPGRLFRHWLEAVAETEQPLALSGDEVIDLRRRTPAEIEALRKSGLFCPVCRKEGRIVISSAGPVFSHEAGHEPETPRRMRARSDLRSHLQGIIFPGARVALNAVLEQGIADIAVVRPNGTRIAIRLLNENIAPEEIFLWDKELRAERIRPMWILDAQRLPPAASRGLEAEVRAVSYRGTECALLRLGEPLLHYEPERRLLHLVDPQPELYELIGNGDLSMGRVSSLIRRYRLSSLHVRAGEWWRDRGLFEEELPIPPPEVPERILKRLDRPGSLGQTTLREEPR